MVARARLIVLAAPRRLLSIDSRHTAMVSTNPLFAMFSGKGFRATVVEAIFPQVLFYTAVSAAVTVVSKTRVHLGVSNQMLTVLGIVLGLVVTFRTTSAYERYQDGRQRWTDIIVASKHLAQLIWIHVPEERHVKRGKPAWTKIQVITEKKTMINLIQAYVVSVKHLLRGEPGIHYEDLYPFVAFLPKYANEQTSQGSPQRDSTYPLPLFWRRDTDYNLDSRPTSPIVETSPTPEVLLTAPHRPGHIKALSQATMVEGQTSAVASESSESSTKESAPPITVSFNTEDDDPKDDHPMSIMPKIPCKEPLKPHCNPPDPDISDYFPIVKVFVWLFHLVTCGRYRTRRRNRRRAYAHIVESDVPMQIALVLSDYSAFLMRENHIDQQIAGAMTNNLLLLQDTIANLERICNTPLPWAYQVHLQFTLAVYLILLPFQIYPLFGYITIAATFFTSFLLLGFLEIGQEIENPFNYDENDLKLDEFCFSLHRDLHAITTYKSPLTDRHFLNEQNIPFAPGYDLTALALSQKSDSELPEIRNSMITSWKKVDNATRRKSKKNKPCL